MLWDVERDCASGCVEGDGAVERVAGHGACCRCYVAFDVDCACGVHENECNGYTSGWIEEGTGLDRGCGHSEIEPDFA